MAEQSHPDLRVYGAYLTFSNLNYYVPGKQGDDAPKSDIEPTKEETQRKEGTKVGNELRLLTDVNGYVFDLLYAHNNIPIDILDRACC